MRVLFVSPWYPDYAVIHSGVFVAKQVEAVRNLGHQVSVQVPQIFPAPAGPVPSLVSNSMRQLADHSVSALFNSSGEVTYLPTPVPARGGPLGRADAVADSLALFREFSEDEFDVIHAHVGLPAGLAVAKTYPDTPLVVTEHWSRLAEALEEPRVAAAYGELIKHSGSFVSVSDHLQNQICEAVGVWASEKIEVIPNIVDLEDISFVYRDSFDFRHWIYVGGLMQHKGVQSLLHAFDDYLDRHESDAELTLIGEGPLREWIEGFAISQGFSDRVRLVGSVDHAEVGRHLETADVMVHLSPVETFGIASLEGIAAGLPVVSLRNEGANSAWGEIESASGVLLDLGSTPRAVADAVATLRDNSGKLDLAIGRSMIESRYAPNVIGQRLNREYERVAS